MTIKLHALRALHTVAVATSGFAMRLFRFADALWEFAGGVECWCDEQIYALRPEQERGVPDKGWLAILPKEDANA